MVDTPKIGPTFSSELAANGVSLSGLSWDFIRGTLQCADSDQLAAAQAVLAKHDPTRTPKVVPTVISDRQFFQQLATEVNLGTGTTYITQDEARAAMAAVIPQSLVDLVKQLPVVQQFPTEMQIMGSTSFDRASPIVATLGQLFGMSSADLDALWTAAAAL